MNSITPEHLDLIMKFFVEFYSKDYNASLTDDPHYEIITIGSDSYKVGYIPNNENVPMVMNIKIVRKGDS